jgi:hypothetical protein
MTTSKWFLPSFSLFLGALCFVAFWIGGNPRQGVFAIAWLGAIGVLILLGGRSEMVRGLRGDGRDEYWLRVDRVATLFTGQLTLALIIAMCLWEWGHGRSGTPYVQLGTVAGAAYLAALGVVRWRG